MAEGVDMTWFNKYVFDIDYYRMLKPHHPCSLTPYLLPVNVVVLFVVSLVFGFLLGEILV